MEVHQSVPDLKVRECGSLLRVTPQTEDGFQFVNDMGYSGVRYGNMFLIKSSNLEAVLENALKKELDVDFDVE